MHAPVQTSRGKTPVNQPAALRRMRLCCTKPKMRNRAAAQESAPAKLPELLAMDDDFDQRHAFTPYANWLVPGHVMLGRYPFLEPSRLDSRPEAERQLEQILRAGITTFVSLQAETPAQQDMPVRGAGGFMPYKAAADLIAAGMSGPPPGEIVEGLRNPYLDAFIPARRREAPEAYRNYKPCRPRYVRAPIDDLDVPADTTTFDAAVDDLVARLEQGEKLYIHCWGGRGRSGLAGACLLIRAYGESADAALERVQRAFAQRGDHKDRSPETDEQYDWVRAYAERVAESR